MYEEEAQDVGLVLFSGVEPLPFKVLYPETRSVFSKRSFNREKEDQQEYEEFNESHGVALKCRLLGGTPGLLHQTTSE